jgi:hypothetical protein
MTNWIVDRPCICGSGLESEPTYDARGIYLTRVCDQCRKERLSHFRPEVLTDPGYLVDEPIEPDDPTPYGPDPLFDEWFD